MSAQESKYLRVAPVCATGRPFQDDIAALLDCQIGYGSEHSEERPEKLQVGRDICVLAVANVDLLPGAATSARNRPPDGELLIPFRAITDDLLDHRTVLLLCQVLAVGEAHHRVSVRRISKSAIMIATKLDKNMFICSFRRF